VRNRIDKDGVLVGTPEPDQNDPHNMVTAIKDAIVNGE
jgi:hypothetical protein